MKTLVIGLDAFDPQIFERLNAQGRLPHLGRLAEEWGYARLSVSNPPQSEVSWTSIATGLNPGGHGIFDFVHRNPDNYRLYLSLLPTERAMGGTRFAVPHRASSIFDHAVRQGYPATTLWWPATFPAQRGSPVRTLPGLGTPDILGKLGVGTLFTEDIGFAGEGLKTAVRPLKRIGRGRFAGVIGGPSRKTWTGARESRVPFELHFMDGDIARLQIQKHTFELQPGIWSPVFAIRFRVGLLYSLPALTRAIVNRVEGETRLYFLPLQLHPLRSPWPYATPGRFMRKIWSRHGPFLTLGWPQDTTGLEEQCIDNKQFLSLCESILSKREQILHNQLDDFEEGVVAVVFDTLDRIQHMFMRDDPDIVEAWYVKLDKLVGRILKHQALQDDDRTQVLIVSDHGFARFDYRIHLNRLLIDLGYLSPLQDCRKGTLGNVNWSETKAYAIGLNSLYLNLSGRERDGTIAVREKEDLLGNLAAELEALEGPDGSQVFQRIVPGNVAFEGPLAEQGPDLLVGYADGYRASAETGLGSWGPAGIEFNRAKWGADHCIDSQAVPGVLFARYGMTELAHPSYRDIPELAIGSTPDPSNPPGRSPYTDEEAEIVEERLRSLGYF